MSDKQPKFERPPIPVLGNAPEEEKHKLSEELGRRFSDGLMAELSEDLIRRLKLAEYPKRPYELEFIDGANTALNDLLVKLGLEPIDVTEINFHIFPPDIYKEVGLSGNASYSPKHQLAAVDASIRESPVTTARRLLHEMVHLKGFVSFDIAPKKEGSGYRKGERRVGLSIYESFEKSDKDELYESFRGLNEAVVSEIEDRLGRKVAESSSDPTIQEELRWLESEEASEVKKTNN